MSEAGHNSEIGIDIDDLLGVLTELSDKAKGVSESNGKLRASLKSIIEERGWNNKGLAIIRQIDAMSETSRADFLRTFKPMFNAMLEAAWQKEMEDLLQEVDGQNEDTGV
jgi:hypothetical protein